MKLKKSLSLSLVIMLLVSTFSITGAYAASPIVFDGTTQVVFDQSFGGHSGASDLADFEVAGSDWSYMEYFMIANGGERSVITKGNYDVSDTPGWTFTTKQSCSSKGYYVYLAYDKVNSKGYVLAYSENTKTLALYKDTDFSIDDVNNAVAYVELDAKNQDNTITVNYVKATNTLTVKNSVNAKVITYTPEDGVVTNLNGVFGIEAKSAGAFTLFNMKLVKSKNKVTVNSWRYEKTFSAEDTLEKLADEGFTFNYAGATVGTKSVKFNGTGSTASFVYKPAGKFFEGDYAVEFKASKATTYHVVKFNYFNENNYYEMIAYRSYADTNMNKVIIKKYESGKDPVEIYNGTYGKVYIPNSVTLTYRLSMKKTDGKLNMNIYLSDGSNSYTFDAVDETPFERSGLLVVSGAGNSNLYSLKAWSLASEGDDVETVSYKKDLLDAKFTADDTVSGVKSKYGITLPSGSTFSNGTATYNSTTIATVYVPELTNAEQYSIESQTLRGSSHAFFYWGYAKNYNKSGYAIKVYNGYNDTNDRYELIKYNSSGTGTVLASVPTSTDWYVNNNLLTYNITMKKKSDGSVDIDVSVTCNRSSNKVKTYTMPTYNDAQPYDFTSYIAPYGQALKYIKVDATVTETIGGDATSYTGVFYKDNGVSAIKEMVKGPVYFAHPIAVLNSHVVVAALYEDYEMTDVKTISSADVYEGAVKLFDTTNSTAKDLKIKVYFFDSADTLNKLTAVYELK